MPRVGWEADWQVSGDYARKAALHMVNKLRRQDEENRKYLLYDHQPIVGKRTLARSTAWLARRLWLGREQKLGRITRSLEPQFPDLRIVAFWAG